MRHDVAGANRAARRGGLPRGAGRHAPPARRAPLEVRDPRPSPGWSDWVRAAAGDRPRAERGRASTPPSAPTTSAPGSSGVQEGDFDLSLGWSFEGPTPYTSTGGSCRSATVKPAGRRLDGELAPLRQRAGRRGARRVRARARPRRAAAPVATSCSASSSPRPRPSRSTRNPSWAEYNTSRFKGFPSADDPYADPSPNKFDRGECLLVLTRSSRARRGRCATSCDGSASTCLAAWAALTLNFFLPRLMPGDPATALFARFRGRLAPEAMQALRETFGLTDAPLLEPVPHLPRPRAAGRPRHLGGLLPVPGLHGHRHGAPLDHLPGRHGGGRELRPRHAARRRRGLVAAAAGSTRCCPRRSRFLGAFPYFWLAMVALYVLGFPLGWFPLGHAYGDDLTPGLQRRLPRRRRPARGAARRHGGAGDAGRLAALHAQHDDRRCSARTT